MQGQSCSSSCAGGGGGTFKCCKGIAFTAAAAGAAQTEVAP